MARVHDLPALPTVEIITRGLYKVRFRELSVFYSHGDPIAYQYKTHHPIVRQSTDRKKDFHYEKLNISARLRVRPSEFDERFLAFVENHWGLTLNG